MILINILRRRLRIDNLKSQKIVLVVITFVSSILSYSFLLPIYLPLTTYCVANLNQLHSSFCRLSVFVFTYLFIHLQFLLCIFVFLLLIILARLDQHCQLRSQGNKDSLSNNKNVVVVVVDEVCKNMTLGIESSIKPIVDKRSELFSSNYITP